MKDYPNSSKVKECRKKIAELVSRKAQGVYDVAEYYEGQKIYSSARIYYQEVIQAYPESPLAKESQKRLKKIAGLKDSKTFEMKREEKEKQKEMKEEQKLRQQERKQGVS
jgi:outer membrane protein assembly factor BamD (BamD/ComL family)